MTEPSTGLASLGSVDLDHDLARGVAGLDQRECLRCLVEWERRGHEWLQRSRLGQRRDSLENSAVPRALDSRAAKLSCGRAVSRGDHFRTLWRQALDVAQGVTADHVIDSVATVGSDLFDAVRDAGTVGDVHRADRGEQAFFRLARSTDHLYALADGDLRSGDPNPAASPDDEQRRALIEIELADPVIGGSRSDRQGRCVGKRDRSRLMRGDGPVEERVLTPGACPSDAAEYLLANGEG